VPAVIKAEIDRLTVRGPQRRQEKSPAPPGIDEMPHARLVRRYVSFPPTAAVRDQAGQAGRPRLVRASVTANRNAPLLIAAAVPH